jgi:hypothetical protein
MPNPSVTAERAQLERDVLPTAGGSVIEADQPWKAISPRDAVERMDRLLQLVEECGGSTHNFRSDLAENARYKPFVLTSGIAQPSFYALCYEHVIPAWFIRHERISSDHLARFYKVVLGKDHKLPYVDTLEGQTSPVSWFRSVGNGFWQSMRPEDGYVPLLIQDSATGSALYGRSRLPVPGAYRPRRSPAGSNAPLLPRMHAGRGDLHHLLLLVRQMGAESDDGLLSEAIRSHVKRVVKRHRHDTRSDADADGDGIPASLYRED